MRSASTSDNRRQRLRPGGGRAPPRRPQGSPARRGVFPRMPSAAASEARRGRPRWKLRGRRDDARASVRARRRFGAVAPKRLPSGARRGAGVRTRSAAGAPRRCRRQHLHRRRAGAPRRRRAVSPVAPTCPSAPRVPTSSMRRRRGRLGSRPLTRQGDRLDPAGGLDRWLHNLLGPTGRTARAESWTGRGRSPRGRRRDASSLARDGRRGHRRTPPRRAARL